MLHKRRQYLTLGLVILGAFGVAIGALPYKTFELDRHFVPKELALHLTALVTALLVLSQKKTLSLTRVDVLLCLFIGLSVLSAAFATNWWTAERAIAITCSGITLFWVARSLAHAGLGRALLAGLAFVSTIAVLTALAQAYGVVGEYASLSRAPGGTFGNRNFMAHLAAICLPTLIFLSARTRKAGVFIGTVGITIAAAGLVLSRTRAAWLALGICALLCIPLIWRMRRLNDEGPKDGRLRLVLIAMLAGSVGALIIPNDLDWRSDSPYLDSMKGVVNYKEGSGQGRVQQYKNSLRLVMSHPVLGVGPGNWPVVYPTVAARRDKSIDRSNGMTANPWPSSDWIALIAERGVPALIVFSLAWLGLIVGAWRQWKVSDSDRAMCVTLFATLVTTALTGMFDAVLLIAIPSLFAWSLLGALMPSMPIRYSFELSAFRRTVLFAVVGLFGVIFSLRSAGQMHAMSIYDGSHIKAVRAAAMFDPGSYRIQKRLAELYINKGNCRAGVKAARKAAELFPAAPEPKRLLRRCGGEKK